MKAFVLGALSALLVILLLLAVSVAYDHLYTNQIVYSGNVLVVGKICNDTFIGETISKIQTSDGNIYFIDNKKCTEIESGEKYNITFRRIRNGANDNFVFNRINDSYKVKE